VESRGTKQFGGFLLMSYKYIHLWQTPIYHTDLDIGDTVLQYVKSLEYERMPNDKASYTISKTVLDDPKLKALKDEIISNVNMFLFDHLHMNSKHFGGFYITSSWVNRFDKTDYGEPHIHENSLFSGVLYLHAPKLSGGELVFKAPENITYSTMSFDYNWDAITGREFDLPVHTNQLVIFPSKVTHKIKEYKGETPRYSLAFNVFYNGELGDRERYLKVGNNE
jgi:uncharacterized protein (TIGR02466 family)